MSDLYVVTGGAGFIGCNIVRELVKRDKRVKVIDNLATGIQDNIADLKDRIEFIKGSITDLDLLQREFNGVDYVLHQAALPSVPRSIADPIASNQANIDGTLNVLVAARDMRVKRVVFAASSSVYGNAQAEFKSEDLPVAPLSPYALTKYAGEVYCRLFTDIYGLETVALRYFNVFGPYQNPQSEYTAVIPSFITSMLRGEPPVIYGDGEQSRDFTYVANNVEANILAAESAEGSGEVLNIACGASISLNHLVALINRELNISIMPIYQPARKGDIKNSLASITKARELIGYVPRVLFEEGLRQTIAWYKER